MAKVSQVKVLKPNDVQAHFLKCNYPQILLAGGRGSGKSYSLIMKCQQHHDMYGEHASILVLRRTMPELGHWIKIARQWLPYMGWTWKAGAKKFVHNQTGAEILCRFLERNEDAAKLQGHEYTLILIDEAGSWTEPDGLDELWGVMRSGAGVNCQMILTANPGGVGASWLRERFVDPAPGGYVPIKVAGTPITRYYLHSTALDNPDLMKNNPKYLEQLKMVGPPHLQRAWIYGDWTASAQGNLFRREYFNNRYTVAPSFIRIIQSWDTGHKKGKNNDRSACTTWGVTRSGVYLLHAWADKVEFPELKQVAKDLAARFRPHVVYIEDKQSGISLCQELKRDTNIPVLAVKVDQDKIARASAVTPYFHAGKVWLPQHLTPEMVNMIEELISFPLANHDDYVDSVSQGISRVIHFANSLENYSSKVVPFTGSMFAV